MTSLEVLNLTDKQLAALNVCEIEEVEQINGDLLNKIDGRLRNGIALKLAQWQRRQNPSEPAADEAPPEEAPIPLWHGIGFGERLANLREQRSYIRKLTKHGMDYSAVLFDDLLNQVRDLFLQWGISWHTHATEIIHSRSHDRDDLLIMEDLIIFTFRFQCVEGPTDRSQDPWCRDIQVPARSLDVYDPNADYPQGDKGPGKAHTYGQKIALRTLLNLPAGDDPDFTPAASLGTRTRALRDERVDRLRRALTARGVLTEDHVQAQFQNLLDGLNERYQRNIGAIEDVPDGILLGWCEYYERRNGNDGSGSENDGQDSAGQAPSGAPEGADGDGDGAPATDPSG